MNSGKNIFSQLTSFLPAYEWLLCQEGLSGKTPAHSFLRCAAGKKAGFSDQQFQSARSHDHRALSAPLANRAVLQVDQAAPQNQSLLWHSDNAVKTQIWIAISIYVLVAINKKYLNLERSLYSILQILSTTLFEKMPLLQTLTHMDIKEQNTGSENQLNLFS